MSSDPHAPTPAGPDPDDAATTPDPFAPAPAAGVDEGGAVMAEPAPEEPTEAATPATVEVPAAEPTATVPVGEGTLEQPAGTAAPEADWLGADASTAAATPEPEPLVQTPSSFTPLGTPEPGIAEKAQAITEKPEAMVGLAFLGGAVASFLLKRLGR